MTSQSHDTIKIVPYSGVQFLVYEFDLEKTPRFSRSFIEHKRTEVAADGTVAVELRPGWNDDNIDADPPFPARGTDNQYDISKPRALEAFLNEWVPVPYLAVQPGRDALGRDLFHQGPTNWCRVRVSPAEEGSAAGITHRAVFAFDTDLLERRPQRACGAGDAQSQSRQAGSSAEAGQERRECSAGD